MADGTIPVPDACLARPLSPSIVGTGRPHDLEAERNNTGDGQSQQYIEDCSLQPASPQGHRQRAGRLTNNGHWIAQTQVNECGTGQCHHGSTIHRRLHRTPMASSKRRRSVTAVIPMRYPYPTLSRRPHPISDSIRRESTAFRRSTAAQRSVAIRSRRPCCAISLAKSGGCVAASSDAQQKCVRLRQQQVRGHGVPVAPDQLLCREVVAEAAVEIEQDVVAAAQGPIVRYGHAPL